MRVPLRSAVTEGRAVLQAEALQLPGLYRIVTEQAAEGTPALALNLPRGESDLTPLPSGEITRRLDMDPVRITSDRAGLLRTIEDHRIGRSYGEHVLWLVLMLVALEFFYANRLQRSRTTVGRALGWTSAGRVKRVGAAPAPARGEGAP
jgi:hypothetical protein